MANPILPVAPGYEWKLLDKSEYSKDVCFQSGWTDSDNDMLEKQTALQHPDYYRYFGLMKSGETTVILINRLLSDSLDILRPYNAPFDAQMLSNLSAMLDFMLVHSVELGVLLKQRTITDFLTNTVRSDGSGNFQSIYRWTLPKLEGDFYLSNHYQIENLPENLTITGDADFNVANGSDTTLKKLPDYLTAKSVTVGKAVKGFPKKIKAEKLTLMVRPRNQIECEDLTIIGVGGLLNLKNCNISQNCVIDSATVSEIKNVTCGSELTIKNGTKLANISNIKARDVNIDLCGSLSSLQTVRASSLKLSSCFQLRETTDWIIDGDLTLGFGYKNNALPTNSVVYGDIVTNMNKDNLLAWKPESFCCLGYIRSQYV